MPRREDPVIEAVVRAVGGVYAELAERRVERSCSLRTECCQFRLTGKTPHLTKGEALVAARAFKSTGRKSLLERPDGACPLLDPGTSRCLIYANRPFGCRTHFCGPAGGPLARNEVIDLIHRLEDAARMIGGSEARPITPALREFLEQAPPRTRR